MRKMKINITNPLIFQLSIFILCLIFLFSVYAVFDYKASNLDREVQLIYQKLDYNSRMVQLLIEEKGNYLVPLKSIFESGEIEDLLLESTNNKYLKTIINDKYVSNPYIGLNDGRFLSGTDWVPGEGYDPRTRVWYQDALTGNAITFTRPYIDLMSYDYTISAVVPLYIKGEFSGVLGEDIYLNELSDFIKDLKLPGDGISFVCSEEGFIIGHVNKNYIASNSHDISGYKNLMFLIDKGEQIFEANFLGDEAIVFVSDIPILKSKFIYILDKDYIYNPLDAMAIKYIFFLFIIVALILVVLFKTTVHYVITDASNLEGKETATFLGEKESLKMQCRKEDIEYRIISRMKNTISYISDLSSHSANNEDKGNVEAYEFIKRDLSEITLNMIEMMEGLKETTIKSRHEVFSMNDVFSELLEYFKYKDMDDVERLKISRFEIEDTVFIGNRMLVKDVLISLVNSMLGARRDISIEIISEYDGYFYTVAFFLLGGGQDIALDLKTIEKVVLDIGGNFVMEKRKIQLSIPMYLHNDSKQSIESYDNMYDMSQMKGRIIYDNKTPGIGAILDIIKSKDIEVNKINDKSIIIEPGDIVFISDLTSNDLLDGLEEAFVVYILNNDRSIIHLDDVVKDVLVRPITSEKVYDKIRNRNKLYEKMIKSVN